MANKATADNGLRNAATTSAKGAAAATSPTISGAPSTPVTTPSGFTYQAPVSSSTTARTTAPSTPSGAGITGTGNAYGYKPTTTTTSGSGTSAANTTRIPASKPAGAGAQNTAAAARASIADGSASALYAALDAAAKDTNLKNSVAKTPAEIDPGKIASEGNSTGDRPAPKKELPSTTMNRVSNPGGADPDTDPGANPDGGNTGDKGGNTGSGGNKGGTQPKPLTSTEQYPDYDPTKDTAMGGYTPGTEIDRAALFAALLGDPVEADIDHINYYDRQYLVDKLEEEIATARDQYKNRIDYGVRNQAQDLNWALQDAQNAFQTQQNQIALDERNAMDNSALYAEMRGDDGGIGRAQYDSIQNTAAQNRVAVRQAQSQLTTDTARQIADLRAQGEFQKADAMLQLTQEYLSRLQQIEQFAANYNLTVDQVNTAIDEWEAEFAAAQQKYQTGIEMSLAELTGGFSDGTPTYSALQQTNQTSAQLALQLLQSGASPAVLSDAQRRALKAVYGLEPSNLAAVAQLLAAANQAGSSGGGGGGRSGNSSSSSNSSNNALDPNGSGDPTSLEQLQADAIRDGMKILKGSNATQQQIATITNNLEGLGVTGASRDRDMWTNYGNGF